MYKVLLLSASTGGGHNSAAKAIKDSLEKLDCEVLMANAIRCASPALDVIISEGYEKSAKYIPRTYGSLYKMSSRRTRKKSLDKLMYQLLGRKILNLVNDKKPDAIISTHPFAIMAMMKYKEQGIIKVPIISVLTDYTAHPAYMQKQVDAYIVGDSDVSYLLSSFGIDRKRIYPFGIPISDNFLSDEKKVDQVKQELKLEDKFTVLLMGGSFGAGNIRDNLTELLESSYDFQIVVITGRDTSLKNRLDSMLEVLQPDKNVIVLGFTKNMPELMTIGDVLVTKPGGLTTTEAIIKEIPMIIPFYIPGQEEGNVDYLMNNGMALKTSNTYSLSALIEMLIDNPERLEEMSDRMAKRRKTDSAAKIAELTVDLINKNR